MLLQLLLKKKNSVNDCELYTNRSNGDPHSSPAFAIKPRVSPSHVSSYTTLVKPSTPASPNNQLNDTRDPQMHQLYKCHTSKWKWHARVCGTQSREGMSGSWSELNYVLRIAHRTLSKLRRPLNDIEMAAVRARATRRPRKVSHRSTTAWLVLVLITEKGKK